MYSSPWPQFGQVGQQQPGFGQRPPMTTHCLGKNAWNNNLADQRSQAEREGEAREKAQMTEQNCEVIMLCCDAEYIGLQELMKKERTIMVAFKANNDFEKSIDWGVMLAERIDLSQYDDVRFTRLMKLLDGFIEQERIENCSVRHLLNRMNDDSNSA